eukprot:CAMPEP_0178595906 /NCGR_PEP_ID=MMETSP0697-20121206/31339_1 /TAXON_ID=265572 /ORGANISM="Extubocellulus spinifer, Strain CCMP396" /LENGTH=144 /DNA_ID=CAMNT_0020233399 /DNA_START=360 /DNA_END=794 /DNA_ORIENTATION=+
MASDEFKLSRFVAPMVRRTETAGGYFADPNLEIIVPLIAKLLLACRIECKELGRQQIKVSVSDGAHFDLFDYLEVWRHHGNAAKQCLEILWQLLTAGVAGIRGYKERAHLLHYKILRIAGEFKYLQALLLGILCGQELLRHHRQ